MDSRITRRSFLTLTAFAPLVRLGAPNQSAEPGVHHFAYDYVLGTSLDLDVWTSNAAAAERAENAVVAEIQRLSSILSTRDPQSEISRFEQDSDGHASADLAEILAAYDHWKNRSAGVLSIRPHGPQTPRNVDALGKAYIIDRAAAAALAAAPEIDGLLLNIGGDIVARGRACEIAVTDPRAWQDNAKPITYIQLHNAAVATSGAYARGAHLIDARSGQPVLLASSATVVARDAVTANALATTLCVTSASEGLRLVEQTAGAAALRVDIDGTVQRTSGFAGIERPRLIRTAALAAGWPAGYELNISLTLTTGSPPFGGRGGFGGGRGGGGFSKRQYVAVWIEDTSGKLVRVLAFWADKARYYNELSSFVTILGRNQNRLSMLARATRAPGNYHLVWDGLDDKMMPVPEGTYRVVVETNQEHGAYGKQAGTIECAKKPAELMLAATSNFEAVTIQFGPRPKQA